MKFGIIVAAGVLALGTAAFAQTMPAVGDQNPYGGWGRDNTNWSGANGLYTDYGSVYTGLSSPDHTWQLGSNDSGGNITVSADIEMWLNMALDQTNIYFHIGSDRVHV
jgi:hypothetical protein